MDRSLVRNQFAEQLAFALDLRIVSVNLMASTSGVKWMLRFAVLMLAGLAGAGSAFAQNPVTVPVLLRGIWMQDNGAGHSQCRDYLSAVRKKDETARNHLVGAEVIGARGLHSYAEYGEGNFYRPLRVTALGKQSWRIKTLVGFDGPPEANSGGRATLALSVMAGKLRLKVETINGRPGNGSDNKRYFRCSSVPAGMYGV